MKVKNAKKGFTIIECIIAMSIISIISAVAISIFQSVVAFTNDRWNEFQVIQMANNIFSCFKASDEMEVFGKYISDLTNEGNSSGNTTTTTIQPGTHQEFDSKDTVLETEYSRIVADEIEHTVAFMKDESPLLSFPYADAATYKNDVHDSTTSLDNNNLFSVETVSTDATPESVTITMKFMTNNTFFSIKMYAKNADGTYKDIEYTYSGKTKEQQPNDFEEYLIDNQYYLVPCRNYSTNTNWFSCYVCNWSDGSRVINPDNKACYLIYRITVSYNNGFSYSDIDNNAKKWGNVSNASINIKDVYKANGYKPDSEATKITGYDGLEMGYYLYILIGQANNGSVTSWKESAAQVDGDSNGAIWFNASEYTKPVAGKTQKYIYTPKDNGNASIYYLLSNTSYTKVFNQGASSDVMLFCYSGNQTITGMDIFNTTTVLENGDTKRTKTRTVNKVTCNDTAKKIIFYDANNNESIRFEYTNASVYAQDKNDLTGVYLSEYNSATDLTLKTPGNAILRKGTDSSNHSYYQVVIGTDVVFVSYADTIVFNSTQTITNSFEEKQNNSEQGSTVIYARTKYYSYTKGNHAIVAKVTYSTYVGDISVEPKLKIWLMKMDDFNSWRTTLPSEPTSGTVIVNYRKG